MKKMTKIFGAMIVAVIALVVVSSVAMAAGPRYGDGDGVRDLLNEGGTTLYGGRAYGFVDEDGDGINDRYTDGSPLFVDEDGDGVCDLLNQDGEMAAYSYGYARMAENASQMGAGRGGYGLRDGSGLGQAGTQQSAFGGYAGDCPLQ